MRAVNCLLQSIHRAYRVKSKFSFWRHQLHVFLTTIFLIVIVFVALGLMTFGKNLLTWLSGLAISYSLAISLQGYVEGKITVIERIAYLGVIVLTITASKLFSIVGIALFLALFGFRKLQAKKAAKAAA